MCKFVTLLKTSTTRLKNAFFYQKNKIEEVIADFQKEIIQICKFSHAVRAQFTTVTERRMGGQTSDDSCSMNLP
jgi:hypothetical protein